MRTRIIIVGAGYLVLGVRYAAALWNEHRNDIYIATFPLVLSCVFVLLGWPLCMLAYFLAGRDTRRTSRC